MKLTPMAPRCGVEISGVTLAQAEGETLDSIRQAIWEHGVAVFRDQDFSPDDHIAFARRWGGIDVNNYFPLHGEQPEIAIVKKEADESTNIGGAWHTDHSYDQVPAMGSILVARDLPPEGGDTEWAHMGAAYDALPQDLKDEIEGLEAFHTADHVYKADGIYAKTDMGKNLRGQDLKTGASTRWWSATRKRASCSTSMAASHQLRRPDAGGKPAAAGTLDAALTGDNQSASNGGRARSRSGTIARRGTTR